MKNMKKSKLIKKVAACLMVVVSIFAMCACKLLIIVQARHKIRQSLQ